MADPGTVVAHIRIGGDSYVRFEKDGSIVFGFIRNLSPDRLKNKTQHIHGALDKPEFVIHGKTFEGGAFGVRK